jgi:outer membrane biosynthesis protein TonB
MHEPVDDIVQRRRADPQGLGRAMSASVAVHVGAVLVMFLVPPDWYTTAKAEPILMTISLGGSPGEKTSGMIAAGARPVEEVAKQPKRPEPIPPAPPPKTAPIAVATKPPVKPPAKTDPSAGAVTRPPTTGTEVTKGTAVAETRSTTQGTGLQVGGGGAGDAQIKVDTSFCCPDYLSDVLQRIQRVWDRNQPVSGENTVVFVIRRDGTVSGLEMEKPSGNVMLDIASMDVFKRLVLARLPAEYTAESLKVHLKFPYVR